MATDSTNHLSYLMRIDVQHQDALGSIRHWANLKTGIAGGYIWLKELTHAQLNTVEMKSMPWHTIYYEKENRLFLYGSLLPAMRMPNVLWTPVERGIPLTRGKENFNFFGLNQQLRVKITRSMDTQPGFALYVSLDVLGAYINNAPAVRLGNLLWILIGSTHAIITGAPMLPIPGEAYWQRGNFLLPAGYDLELHLLGEYIAQKIDPTGLQWIAWNKSGSYFVIHKEEMQPLTIGSFRNSMS